ncbi:MAG: hypothetical protein UZ17_ACD001002347 [Acidobacteria bacterium OLB17]|nr:MAG: hypothetical protein UZ17_ACD001002347 [Acidobacteria bacterium OLB17]
MRVLGLFLGKRPCIASILDADRHRTSSGGERTALKDSDELNTLDELLARRSCYAKDLGNRRRPSDLESNVTLNGRKPRYRPVVRRAPSCREGEAEIDLADIDRFPKLISLGDLFVETTDRSDRRAIDRDGGRSSGAKMFHVGGREFSTCNTGRIESCLQSTF